MKWRWRLGRRRPGSAGRWLQSRRSAAILCCYFLLLSSPSDRASFNPLSLVAVATVVVVASSLDGARQQENKTPRQGYGGIRQSAMQHPRWLGFVVGNGLQLPRSVGVVDTGRPDGDSKNDGSLFLASVGYFLRNSGSGGMGRQVWVGSRRETPRNEQGCMGFTLEAWSRPEASRIRREKCCSSLITPAKQKKKTSAVIDPFWQSCLSALVLLLALPSFTALLHSSKSVLKFFATPRSVETWVFIKQADPVGSLIEGSESSPTCTRLLIFSDFLPAFVERL